ncbi:MAG: DUF3604 domain-containing protein [Deltaproteobacteria bacterium]|nr:DUF3604 domain-containing protein [Deltaproteobacteria bacterium]
MAARTHVGPLIVASTVLVSLHIASCSGEHQGPGDPTPIRVPARVVTERSARQIEVAGADAKQILFGDLHVHTTFSPDAFLISLPMMGGEGAHPPADACDYARFCSALDFWSINDHAEGVSPQHWQESIESIGQCNALAGDPANPDMVSFLGWEWTQVGTTPERHFGHKNVVLRDFAADRVPRRPIAAPRPEFRVPLMPRVGRVLLPLRYFGERQRFYDYFLYQKEVEATRACVPEVDTRDLPPDCHEIARDPAELFAKLDQWGFPSLVIPHGTSWGLMTPALSSWDLQLDQRHPRESLFEIYSGHGSSEEYRPWRAADLDSSGELVCPAPGEGYEPCCWRAGEIIRSRCEEPGSALCEQRVAAAQKHYVAAGVAGHNTVPGATVEDWGQCGQCSDCFLPAFNLRPAMSGQFALATGFAFGFIGSSDSHTARGGNGFKEHARRGLTEGRGPLGAAGRMVAGNSEPAPESVPVVVSELPLQKRRYTERGASFLVTGGLAALHSTGRDREAVFESLERREVYGTSGDRILLWFDLLNGPGGTAPMGAEVSRMATAPRFRVAAAGAFEQRPGCPAHVREALSPERIHSLCLDECYNPADRRRRITRIEVVRIRPGEGAMDGAKGGMQGGIEGGVGERIEDPWRVLPCPSDAEGCRVVFEDPDFLDAGRRSAYYVRAIQEPTQAVNGDGLRCEVDARGQCVRVRPCFPDERTPFDDDCLGEVEERAWSSPIFITPVSG